MRRTTLVLVALLIACAPRELKPNGTNGVLSFEAPRRSPGEGLSTDLTVLSQYTVENGCGKLDFTCDRKTFSYDFTGTSLVLTPPAGLEVTAQSLTDRGWLLTLRCDTELANGGRGALGVRVNDRTGAAKYQDSTNVDCFRASGLNLTAQYPHYARGAPVRVRAALIHGQAPLDGRGWSLDDPQHTLATDAGEVDSLDHSELEFIAVSPGSGASMHAGATQAELPFDVVADSAWSLQLGVDPCSSNAVKANVSGVATSDGKAVGLPENGCAFTYAPPDGGTAIDAGVRFCGSCVETPQQAGTLCVGLSGKSACTPFAL